MGDNTITARPGQVIRLPPGQTFTPIYPPSIPGVQYNNGMPYNNGVPFNNSANPLLNNNRFRYNPVPQTFNNLGGLSNMIDKMIVQPGNQRIRRRQQAAHNNTGGGQAARPAPQEPQTPQPPSPRAAQLGVDGMLEQFFAEALDTRQPLLSPVKVPDRLDDAVNKSIMADNFARAHEQDHYGMPEAIKRRDERLSADQAAAEVRDRADIARYILTGGRQLYAHLVNEQKEDHVAAARFVVQCIEDADEACKGAVSRTIPSQFRELTKTLDADMAGSMPYKSRNTEFKPYVIPQQEARVRILTPEESRLARVEQVRQHITDNLNGMKDIARGHKTGEFVFPVGVQPHEVERWLTEIKKDLEKDGKLDTPRITNFVPIDKKVLAGMNPKIQEAVKRVEDSFKNPAYPPVIVETPTKRIPGAGVVNELHAHDLEIVADLLTGKVNELSRMQGRLPRAQRPEPDPLTPDGQLRPHVEFPNGKAPIDALLRGSRGNGSGK